MSGLYEQFQQSIRSAAPLIDGLCLVLQREEQDLELHFETGELVYTAVCDPAQMATFVVKIGDVPIENREAVLASLLRHPDSQQNLEMMFPAINAEEEACLIATLLATSSEQAIVATVQRLMERSQFWVREFPRICGKPAVGGLTAPAPPYCWA
ncbi:hypothetical protein [Roseiconus lacunae]|uniref:hypothetical protein n=1 Tax=Roseiconus lacunae TaxID=2605694 RepID=UPI001E45A9B1|nr:hypothetical protein [Roseiconus lacunae]MCD0457916.1 hypothetical protein [Roseiconus lacunae]